MSENLITGRNGSIGSYIAGPYFEKALKKTVSYFIVVEKAA